MPGAARQLKIERKVENERKALIGYLAGQCQSHMYPLEGAKRPLAHATRKNKNSNQMTETNRNRTLILTVTTAERSDSANVYSLEEIMSLHR